MTKRFGNFLLLGALASCVVSFAGAQTADDPDAGLRAEVHPTTADTYLVSWWGKTGHTYFLQHSTNLTSWTNLDVMEEGADAVMSIAFASTGVTDFWRVSWIDLAPSDLENADFDGDGLTNAEELTTTHTDPLKADTDGDGLSDEAELLASPATNPLKADTDDDGLWDKEELLLGTAPTTATTTDNTLALLVHRTNN